MDINEYMKAHDQLILQEYERRMKQSAKKINNQDISYIMEFKIDEDIFKDMINYKNINVPKKNNSNFQNNITIL